MRTEGGGPSTTNQNRIFLLALNNNNMDLGGGGGGRRRIINNRLPRVNRSNVKEDDVRPMGGSEIRCAVGLRWEFFFFLLEIEKKEIKN